MSNDQTSEDVVSHRRKCLDEINSLLLGAGYFKAGDPSIGDYDKVRATGGRHLLP